MIRISKILELMRFKKKQRLNLSDISDDNILSEARAEIESHEAVRSISISDIEKILPGLEQSSMEIIRDVYPFTMTGAERLASLIASVDYVVDNDIPGALVEAGVWKGGSVMAMIKTLLRSGVNNREIFLYDTFEGMSEPSDYDISPQGLSAHRIFREYEEDIDGKKSNKWCRARLDEVKELIGGLGYPTDRIHFVKGKVEDTIPDYIPEQIALLRLDTDWYESTKHELEHLFPRLAFRGVLILDDYGYWKGQKKAVDEYFSALPYFPLLQRVDPCCRLAIKA